MRFAPGIPETTTLRFVCLMTAMIVYALAGSPTPNAPGLIEAVIAVLLICAAGVPGLYNVLKPEGIQPLWFSASRGLFIYGVCVSLIAAAARGQEAVYVVRDVAPFLFLLLPLFLHDIFERRPDFLKPFTFVLALCGVVFAVRSGPEIFGWWHIGDYSGELYYFANMPSVLFAAIFFAGLGAWMFAAKFSFRALLFCLFCFALAVLPLAAVTLTLQRASVGIFILSMAVLAGAGIYRYPYRAIFIFLIVAAFSYPVYEIIAAFKDILIRKSGAVGLNMRSEELSAAWEEISSSPITLLLGTGWGGTFESPAVGGVRVNYTHSLLSAMLLKTGMIGVTLTLAYLWGLFVRLLPVLRHNIVLVLAVAGPVTIDVFLYASYKSLDFGLVLLLAAAAGAFYTRPGSVASGRRVLYSNHYSNAF